MPKIAVLFLFATSMALSDTALVMRTEKGDIELLVDEVHAPKTAANFLRYVDAKAYDGGVFHRTVTMQNQPQNKIKIEVIQGSVREGAQEYGALALERTTATGLKHKDGTLSMARTGADDATVDFFICVGDQPELDFGGKRNPDGQGFAAFGRVTKGMDVVRAIQQSHAEGQVLTPFIQIVSVRRK